ncbi:MAG TPA: hypothetical protein PKY86_00155 [Niabella sp.]|nr:hypothetical protein [Niabella sp.]HQW15006.1 hypothetical protein [Niabella sp.]HQX20102.1 hypothetical protein [Niabella sp.]HQX40386.1 hypothetical protein [Niabella sp.]HRB06707.1 hypothetical protein [Niabella sp.]
MKPSQIIALIAIATLVAACFIPWMRIDDPAITITGVDTTGTNFGKPALNHLILTAFILLFTFVPKMGAKRANLFFAALNLAWAIKNYAVIPRCEGGICPERLLGLHLVLIASIIMMITTLFPKAPPLKKPENVQF